MQVIYANGAKFAGPGIGSIAHQFARALHETGHLQQAIVGYSEHHGLPAEKVQEFPWMRLVARLARDNHPVRDTIFDFAASRFITETDVFHGWSDQSLRTLQKARQHGAVTFIERPNSHPRNQERILREEYDRWGFSERHPVRPRGMERATAEFELADYITVPSRFAYDSMLAEGVSAEKVHLVPYGVDVKRFHPEQRRPNTFRLLFVGQVSLRKGVPYLLEAWRQLSLPEAELWLAGRITPDAEQAVAPYRNDLTVRFLGHVRQMEETYRQVSAFVLPSLEEGSALVTYEAMASALPLIITPNTGAVARDDIEGILTPIRDVSALSMAIERLYENPDLCIAMGAAGRKRAEQYTWDAAGQVLIETYRQVVSRAAPR